MINNLQPLYSIDVNTELKPINNVDLRGWYNIGYMIPCLRLVNLGVNRKGTFTKGTDAVIYSTPAINDSKERETRIVFKDKATFQKIVNTIGKVEKLSIDIQLTSNTMSINLGTTSDSVYPKVQQGTKQHPPYVRIGKKFMDVHTDAKRVLHNLALPVRLGLSIDSSTNKAALKSLYPYELLSAEELIYSSEGINTPMRVDVRQIDPGDKDKIMITTHTMSYVDLTVLANAYKGSGKVVALYYKPYNIGSAAHLDALNNQRNYSLVNYISAATNDKWGFRIPSKTTPEVPKQPVDKEVPKQPVDKEVPKPTVKGIDIDELSNKALQEVLLDEYGGASFDELSDEDKLTAKTLAADCLLEYHKDPVEVAKLRYKDKYPKIETSDDKDLFLSTSIMLDSLKRSSSLVFKEVKVMRDSSDELVSSLRALSQLVKIQNALLSYIISDELIEATGINKDGLMKLTQTVDSSIDKVEKHIELAKSLHNDKQRSEFKRSKFFTRINKFVESTFGYKSNDGDKPNII